MRAARLREIHLLSLSQTTGVAPAARVSAAACAVEIKGEPSMLVFGGMSMESGWLGDVHALGMSTLAWTRLDVSGSVQFARLAAPSFGFIVMCT